MKKILITGANGQLGNSIKKLSSDFPQYSIIYTDEKELDITDLKATEAFFNLHSFDIAVNCAAYNAVDQAEENIDIAERINALGPENLAKITKLHQCSFIHVSTDYVFEGKGHRPYQETDTCIPPSAYGKSKLLGEEKVKIANEKAMIIRTSWLYSEFGHNFMKTMLKYGLERTELKVVYDQIGSPTYANDLARAILEILSGENFKFHNTLYHYSNEGVASWYDFATEIINAAQIDCKISPIESHEYPLPAPRPFYSVLNRRRLRKTSD